MKTMRAFIIGIFTVCCGSTATKAQDVYLSIPENNIFNRSEFTSLPTRVMNTNRTNWDYNFFGFAPTAPTFNSTSGPTFTHSSSSSSLPSSVLLWQLESMGGQLPSTGYFGYLPGFQSFSTSAVKWFEPSVSTLGGGFNRGNINFTFKIPAAQFAANIFRAGNYSMDISQNYNDFTPRNFKTILVIPSSIRWLTTSLTKYIEISSLNNYRTTGTQVFSLENTEIAHTIDFNFWAKASANVQFTSSKGVPGTRNIASIKLGSNGSALTTKALSANFQNFSPANLSVVAGNRNSFTPELYVSADDFKNNFFEAGTYTFELNFNAISTDNSINSLQNTAVQLKVLPRSEITIPSSGRNVNFNFNTAAQYTNGQSQMIPNQIILSNNESFELYVKSDENYFKKGGLQTDINSNILQIGIDGSSVNAPLSKTPQKILFNGTPALDRELNVRYTIPSAGAQSLVGKENTTYSINVYYSFTAI
ncbi:hypothetical protein [Chryseobacterium indoltheticum]|uniref:Uncharacterized protein n=1 Tax=Chryseobacterium indoltheticum TaxID=254 RepID=A0A381FAC5_9FLAO|nr:hypothetical protein [Chryseobacterium indoltheticum]AZA73519.1 hypothetical protein EG358_07005 [Chryseobacterium indoltheticum]SIQ99768.1 hypothetical protein SAMN05421682_1117 [Chryseobacterium indoltheticum]SUX43414.1 Uncharacterised protein [Chryseobacterium indoltheticum]